ncbi:unnamed protein product [Heligmosomoides polygyrus]|uniref:SCP domain-containing protein n=1 Tax=Heligmosomoides polygyrus TaxID=6339 RepID=A0A183GEE9_HELPZ|nr:unnamed protein product [Heligmosomoides polygyrus]
MLALFQLKRTSLTSIRAGVLYKSEACGYCDNNHTMFFFLVVYNDSLHSMALVGAKKVLEGKPHGIETSEFCTYYMTLDTYWHTWENSYMQKLFNMLPFNNIGYVAQKNPGAPYGCAFHAVFADGRHSDYYGDKKILLCTYKISNSNTCDPDERRYDPKTIPDQVQIDFTKK